jgi:8-oxo-dGTP pyrophosphatase MutT (NUDIX family)
VSESSKPILRFHSLGNWSPHQLHITRISGTGRLIVPHIESLIDQSWQQALARPGVKLFDGQMCRLESWQATPDSLHLTLSQTSYKPFLGTNLTHPDLADQYGPKILANPVGVSPALITADNFLMLGRRNASVAYYPNRIHPFAGAMDPNDPDPFAAIRRELHEELSLTPADLLPDGLRCTGIAEDLSIRQPELIFTAHSTRTRQEIESRLDDTEHHSAWAIAATREAIESALASSEDFTPVAIASILLYGRNQFGKSWFGRASAPIV